MSSINLSKTNNTSIATPPVGKFRVFFDLDGLPKYKDGNGDIFLFGNGGNTEILSSLVQAYPALDLVIGDKQKDYNERMLAMVLSLIPHPTYVAPVLSLSPLSILFGEIGTVLAVNLTSSWTQNDAGGIITSNKGIQKNGIPLFTELNLIENITLNSFTLTYRSYAGYNQGAVKNNSLGVPDPVGRINAGVAYSNIRSVYGIYPVFHGVFDTLPVASTVNMSSLTKSVILSTGDVTIPINANDKFLLIAIPQVSTVKTRWFVTELNQGSIGGVSNLFASPVSVNKNSPNSYWNNVSYRFYISNYKTTLTEIQLRNL